MAVLTPAQFKAKWNDRFADNTIQLIDEALVRELAAHTADSFGNSPVNVPLWVAGTFYKKNFVVRWAVGGITIEYAALREDVLPAPTSLTGDANWKPAVTPSPNNVTTQDGSWYGVRQLAGDGELTGGRQYVIRGRYFRPDGLPPVKQPDVYLVALDRYNFRPDVAYTLDNDMQGADPVRVDYDLATDEVTERLSSADVAEELANHEARTDNPHQVTAAQLADFVQAVRAVVSLLAGNVTQDANHRFVTDAQIGSWNGKEAAGVAAALDALQLAGLLDGVSSDGNTLQKLYNMIQLRATQYNVATLAARNALNVKVGTWVNVDDDGDGRWAIYRATSNGVNASYNKVSDPDLLNAAMSAAQIRAAYLSNAGTQEFTTDLLNKLNGIVAGATANSSDATLLSRANHTGTQAISTVTGLQALLDGKAAADVYSSLLYAANLTLDFTAGTAQLLTLTGNVSFAATSNRAQSKAKRVFLTNTSGGSVSLAFPSSWKFMGAVPTALAAGKSAVLSLECATGSAETDVWAGYNAQS